MKVTILEDPACRWCWAFQPVETAFLFEYGHALKLRRMMAGLYDEPVPNPSLAVHHWQVAADLSGMPFEYGIWNDHVLRTTFLACRAFKAAQSLAPGREDAFLRRMREAFCLERTPIDEMDTITRLAYETGIDGDELRTAIATGRVESQFRVDRRNADELAFGILPTVAIRPGGASPSDTVVLRGLTPYADVMTAIADAGFSLRRRRRFHDTPGDWQRLFEVRSRVTLAELQAVTGAGAGEIGERVESARLIREGALYRPGPCMLDIAPLREIAEALR